MLLLKSALRTLIRRRTPILFPDLTRSQPISPVFGLERGMSVDRYYIEQFLGTHRADIQGRVVEVASDTYTQRFGTKVIRKEILHVSAQATGATIIADLTQLASVPNALADCFICTQTFNFIYDLHQAIQGAYRLLKPGGVLLATVAGISQISQYDMVRWGDYWRFTTASAQRLFEEAFGTAVSVQSFGNVLAATAFLQGVALEDLPDRQQLDQHDPLYQLVIGVRACKAHDGSSLKQNE